MTLLNEAVYLPQEDGPKATERALHVIMGGTVSHKSRYIDGTQQSFDELLAKGSEMGHGGG